MLRIRCVLFGILAFLIFPFLVGCYSDQKVKATSQLLRRGEELSAHGFGSAAMYGEAGLVELYLQAGFSPNEAYSPVMTPFWALFYKGPNEKDQSQFDRALDLLLEAHADVNKTGQLKDTTLHRAAGYDWVYAVHKLIAYKASVNARDSYGKTPLYYAVARKNNSKDEPDQETIKALLDAGALVEESETDIAKANNFTNTLQLLEAAKK